SLIDARFGLVTFGLWLLSIMICAFQIPRIVSQFKEEATHVQENTFNYPAGTLIIQSESNGQLDGDFGMVSISLEGTPEHLDPHPKFQFKRKKPSGCFEECY